MPFDNRSRFIDPTSDEELHHDLFVDGLRSVMRPHGTIREVASRTGYSEQYLHLILKKERSVPSPAVLESIIAAIPGVTTRDALSLQRFARRASGALRAPNRSMRMVFEDAEVIPELVRLESASHEATHAATTEVTRRGLFEVRTGARRLAMGVRDPAAVPHIYIRLCLLLNHVQSFLDDPWDALSWARFARAVLAEADERVQSDTATRDLHVSVLMAEAVAWHNLKNDRLALRCYDDAERRLNDLPDDPRPSHIAMGRISALPGTRRFRIGDVMKQLGVVQRQCDAGVHSDALASLLISRARRGLADAYVRHGDLKPRTERVLTEELGNLDRLELAGPIHKVQLYRSVAGFYLARGDREGQQHFAGLGLRTAEAAGLAHQVRQFSSAFPIDR